MANEIYRSFPSGNNLYAVVRNSSGQIWYVAGEVFEIYGTASRDADDYDTPLTDRGNGFYQGDFDENIPASRYTVVIYLRDGPVPVDGDTFISEIDFQWSGSGRVGGGAIITPGTGISAGGVLTFVNNVLRRQETDIDTELQTVLDDLSQGPYIEAVDEEQSLVTGDEYLAQPDRYFSMISIVLNNGSSDLAPLKAFPGGYKAYRDQLGDVESVYVSNPVYYTKWGSVIWLFPIPAQSYTVRIDYYKVHDQDVSTIEFNDEWRRAIYFGTALEVALKRKMPDAINIYNTRYEVEKERQRLAHPGQVRVIGA